MRFLILATAIACFLVLAGVGVAWRAVSGVLEAPSSAGGPPEIIEIPAGAGVVEAVQILRTRRLATPSRWLDFYVEYLHQRGTIRPGEYSVSPTMTPVQQIELIESGNVVTYTISVEAGMTARQVVDLLAEKKLGDAAELLGLIEDQTFVHSLGIRGPSLEGYMFPDIYDLPRGLSGRELLERFVRRFDDATKELGLGEVAGFEPYQIVIMASLIQESEALPKERRLFAALLRGRLAENIALSHKGSNAYGIARLPPDATDEEKETHEWDTANRPGLPLTPIGSPSLDALKAAANPVQQAVLYMVPRDDGTHIFCPDADCYMEAFKKWKGRYPKGLPRKFQ